MPAYGLKQCHDSALINFGTFSQITISIQWEYEKSCHSLGESIDGGILFYLFTEGCYTYLVIVKREMDRGWDKRCIDRLMNRHISGFREMNMETDRGIYIEIGGRDGWIYGETQITEIDRYTEKEKNVVRKRKWSSPVFIFYPFRLSSKKYLDRREYSYSVGIQGGENEGYLGLNSTFYHNLLNISSQSYFSNCSLNNFTEFI